MHQLRQAFAGSSVPAGACFLRDTPVGTLRASGAPLAPDEREIGAIGQGKNLSLSNIWGTHCRLARILYQTAKNFRDLAVSPDLKAELVKLLFAGLPVNSNLVRAAGVSCQR